MVSEYNTIDFFPKEKLYMYTLIDIYIHTLISYIHNFIHIYINTHFVNIIHKYNKYNIYIYTGGLELMECCRRAASCGWTSGCPPVRKKARRWAGVARESEIGSGVARARRRGRPGAPR